MKHYKFLIIIMAMISFAFTTDKPAYILYNQKGKEAKYSKMIDEIKDADLILFGEMHYDPIAHWLQLEITKDVYNTKKENLIIGSEMFEADNQLIMNEYLEGNFAYKKFKADIRLWPNYKTDYKPVVEFAKKKGLKFIATNIPRRYASIVHKKGFEGLNELSKEAKRYFSPDMEKLYDKNVECYAAMLKMQGMGGHVNANFPKAQAAKDATMAHFIIKNWKKGKTFIHFQGEYHSDNFEGIVWWIKKLKPKMKVKTISTVYQKDINKLEKENIDRANYIIVVPENMTQTR